MKLTTARTQFILLISIILLFATQVKAEDIINDDVKPAKSESKTWKPEAVKYDWVQLTSGEWLKGKIKSMYNKNLEFDSDKLDLLSIDWEDVKYLKSHIASNVKIESVGTVVGMMTISDEIIIIQNNIEVQSYNRNKIVSFTPSGDREIDLWALKLTLSTNLRSGNTEQIDFTSKIAAKRRTPDSRFTLDYIGNISKTNAVTGALEETLNNHRLFGGLDIYVTRYFFYNPINAEYFRDPFQNVDQRITIGSGLGYVIKDTSKFEWNLTAGPAYISTKYISVQPGEDIQIDSGSLSISTDLDAEITKRLDFIYKYNIQLSNKASGGYTHYMIATLESEITGDLDFDISAVWDRISHPTVDDLGNIPEPNDFRFLFGVSYSF
ncbi:MAG: DUF481 domain-containing protein [Gammaproteobacteria bacterium]